MSGEERVSASRVELFGATLMNDGRCHETDSRVPVFVVVVVEEVAGEQASIFDGAETTRELGAILQRLELRLGVGIVVRDVRSGVSLGHAEIGQEQGDGLASHRAAPIRVDGELAWFNALLATALADETTSELGAFSVSQHPARHVAGEDVQDDVEVVVGPLDRTTKFRDVPDQTWFGVSANSSGLR